jgi:hypothetical protein
MIGRFCLELSVCIGLAGPALAELAMTGGPVSMHAAPTGRSRVVQRIPANAQIDMSHCSRGWCYASWRNLFGYIPADVIVLGPPAATLPGEELPPPVLYASPTYVTPPVWQWTGAYVGGNLGFGSSPW